LESSGDICDDEANKHGRIVDEQDFAVGDRRFDVDRRSGGFCRV
jgi:hypothetical protein